MAERTNGEQVAHKDALDAWAESAYAELKLVARHYNSVISYNELSERIQDQTGITTKMVLPNWIGNVLERAAEFSRDASEPPLTSLCVRSDGTIGAGYDRAPKSESASTSSDIEVRAAEDRLACYRKFAIDLPADDGRPTLTPQVEDARRRQSDPDWLNSLIETGGLSTHDGVLFRTHVEVAKLFGRNYKGHQRATIRLSPSTHIWFPKLFKNDDWDNSLSQDGATISMRPVLGGRYSDVMEIKPARDQVITFGRLKTPAQKPSYRFVGVFEIDPLESDGSQWVYKKVAEEISFDGFGAYDFVALRRIPIQDDLIAEAAETDLSLVSKFDRSIESGSFAVHDSYGTTKVRGSAQSAFAQRVKTNYGWRCALTGISTREFLIASHIVPWSLDPEIRLDPSNGICLSTFVDRAFDAGFLEITPECRASVRWDRIGNDLNLKSHLTPLDGVDLRQPESCPPDPDKLARRIELGF